MLQISQFIDLRLNHWGVERKSEQWLQSAIDGDPADISVVGNSEIIIGLPDGISVID